MKHFYFKSIFLSLLMMVIGVGNGFAEDRFEKYSGEITEGDYLLVSGETAMNTTVSSNRLQFQAVKIENDVITQMNNGSKDFSTVVWTISKSGDYYTLYNATEGKYAASTGTKNQAQLLESGTDDKSLWTITGTSAYEFVNKKNDSNGVNKNLRKNPGYGFACYSTGTGVALTLYKKVEDEDSPLSSIAVTGVKPTPTFYVGDAFVFGGTVTATYENGDTKDVTKFVEFSEPDMTTTGSKEVTVSYTEGGVTKTATYTITVNALTGEAYTLVTNANDLEEGDKVIIVNTEAGKAMSTTQNTNNRGATAVTFDEDDNAIAIVPSSTDIQVFTLEGDASGWYFNTGSGYIYAASSGNNYLKTETEADDNAKATISISDDDATVKFQGTNTRNLLKYNSGNNLFSCYASGQQPIQLYRKAGASTATLTAIALSGEYPTTFKIGDEFSHEGMTVTATFDDGTTKDVTLGAVFSEPDMNTAGTQTVTVSYKKGEVTKTATYEITVNPVQLTGITLSGDYPTTFNVGDDFSHEGMTVTATYDDNTSEDVTADATFEGYDMNTAGTQTVTVSYTKGDVTKTASYDITVNAVAVTGITLNKEAIQLKVGKTTKLTATVEPDNATDKTVVWSSGDETVATVSEDGTVAAVAEGTATITAGTPDGAKTATCTVTVIAATAPTDYYEKVTSAPEDWSGEYLIVYEEGSVAFDGSLQALDAAENTIGVVLNNGTIEASEEVDAAAFTIATMEGGYSVKAASGKYIGVTSNSNGLTSSDTEIAHSLSIDGSENAVIKVSTPSGDMTLRYNSATNQLRFRYYKEGQQAIQLYKKATGPKSPLASIRVEGYTTDFVVGDTYTFDGTVTAVYEDHTEKDVTNRATFTEPDMTTAGEDVDVKVSYTEGEVTAEETIYINVREPQTIKFRKITSTDELVPGKRYVLVNEDAQKVIAQYYNQHFEVKGAEISDEQVALAEGQVNILTLGGEEGAWTFATSIETGKYLYFNTPGDDSNYLNLGDDATALGTQWTISFDNGNAVIQTNYNKETNNPDRYIRYNPTQPRFACYKGTQQPVQLYVESDLEDVTLTISAAGYATLYYSDRALKVPEDVTAKTYKVVDGKLAESKTYASGSKIPKGEAVVLKGAPGEYTFKVTSTAEPKDADNQLKGTDEAKETTGGNYYYALQAKSKDGKHGPGMYWMNSTGAPFENGAHKAYMALDEKFAEAQAVGGAKEFYLFDEATTGISGIDAASADRTEMYNLNGQRVDRGYKGVVIKNGKKIVIK